MRWYPRVRTARHRVRGDRLTRVRCDTKTRHGCGAERIEQPVVVEAPVTVEGSRVEIEDRRVVVTAGAARRPRRRRQLVEIVGEQMETLSDGEPGVDEGRRVGLAERVRHDRLVAARLRLSETALDHGRARGSIRPHREAGDVGVGAERSDTRPAAPPAEVRVQGRHGGASVTAGRAAARQRRFHGTPGTVGDMMLVRADPRFADHDPGRGHPRVGAAGSRAGRIARRRRRWRHHALVTLLRRGRDRRGDQGAHSPSVERSSRSPNAAADPSISTRA
jgi:hypothetical protein